MGAVFHKLAHYVATSGCRSIGPITVVALESPSTNEQLRQICARVYESWNAVFEEKFLGSSIVPQDAASLALTIPSALEGATILIRTLHNADPLLQTGDCLRHLILSTKTQRA